MIAWTEARARVIVPVFIVSAMFGLASSVAQAAESHSQSAA